MDKDQAEATTLFLEGFIFRLRTQDSYILKSNSRLYYGIKIYFYNLPIMIIKFLKNEQKL